MSDERVRADGAGRLELGELDRVVREEHGRVVAGLARYFGDLDLAEDMAQEAYAVAAERWPRDGLPPNPGAWLTTTARNRGIDRIRRESTRDARHLEAFMLSHPEERGRGPGGNRAEPSAPPDPADPDTVSGVPDERLRLVFTCCHPALAPAAQVALTLRLLGGLSTAEIAAAFLVDEAAMAKRLDPLQAEDQGGAGSLTGSRRTTSCPAAWPVCSPRCT